MKKQSSFSVKSFAFKEPIADDLVKCFSKWCVAPFKRDILMFQPTTLL